MRYMIIVKATTDSEAGVMPPEPLLAAMADYHQQLADAGMLIEGSGLQPSSRGFRIRYHGERRSVVDGPFAESKELIAGYTLIRADSEAQARDWAMRFPNPSIDGGEAEIEIRPLFELDDFEPTEAIDRFRSLDRYMQGESAR